MRSVTIATVSGLACLLAACSSPPQPPASSPTIPTASSPVSAPASSPAVGATADTPSATRAPTGTHTFTVTEHERFDSPWAMTFLPGTDTLAITQKGGQLLLRDGDTVREVSGVPEVTVTAQGGLADIIAGPDFATDGRIFLSWVVSSDGRTGGVVGTATLDVASASLSDVTEIWRQEPFGNNAGHYSLRLAIADGHLFVSSGERQEGTPAQGFDSNLGKIVRLNLDGTPASGNPFADRGGLALQFWSMGHRNPLGLAFDADGRLWASEMGPAGGDELNLIKPGLNYGWPEVSNGSDYGGGDIPDHAPGDGYEPPKVFWNPSISPGSLMIYQGELFPAWRGDAFIGALSGEALARVDLDGESATLAETWPMNQRIREVEEAPDGSIWLLRDGEGAALLELRPA